MLFSEVLIGRAFVFHGARYEKTAPGQARRTWDGREVDFSSGNEVEPLPPRDFKASLTCQYLTWALLECFRAQHPNKSRVVVEFNLYSGMATTSTPAVPGQAGGKKCRLRHDPTSPKPRKKLRKR
jgi:hypothetical protein